jgi:hypothetical protein
MASVVLDGYFMTESADAVFEKCQQAQVPLLAGWNSLEGTPQQSLRGQAPTVENYKNAMKPQFGDMTDEELKAMSKDDANRLFYESDKRRWVRLHNATANLYFVKNGRIEDVEPAGWWR